MKLCSAIYPGYYPFDEFRKDDGEFLFDDFYTARTPEQLKEGSCLVVWGGEDISPSLYGKKVGSRTGAGPIPSQRDAMEWALMKQAKEMGVPIIGVCRGGQMLCALAGGTLVQDTNNHGRSHAVDTFDGESFMVSSLHHQMFYPFDVEHVMLAKSSNKLSDRYLSTDEEGMDIDIQMELEPEAVWFPKEKGFAIQGHPEFVAVDTLFNKWVKKQIEAFILEEA